MGRLSAGRRAKVRMNFTLEPEMAATLHYLSEQTSVPMGALVETALSTLITQGMLNEGQDESPDAPGVMGRAYDFMRAQYRPPAALRPNPPAPPAPEGPTIGKLFAIGAEEEEVERATDGARLRT